MCTPYFYTVALPVYGQYPAPRFTIAHLSDTHLLADGKRQYDTVNPEPSLVTALQRLTEVETPPDALVITGDLTDLGEPAAYERLKELVEATAAELNAPVVWVIGNHDSRLSYSSTLFGTPSRDPQDRVYDLGGLRIVSLDSTVPGYHHGAIEPSQLEWLRDVLATPAEHGTIVAMHHPPLPLAMDRISQVIELTDQRAFADVVRGSDVRAILAGHMHYSMSSLFAGIPVFVASASCYTMDLASKGRVYSGVDGGQAFAMLHVFDAGSGNLPEAPVTHTVVPISRAQEIAGIGTNQEERLRTLSREDFFEVLSKKGPEYVD